ncbi:MAG: ABC transporter ATP-binding protein [Chloroflexi bacterium]|nr:ABC transporter ATP-binding protein [Chloroflexota bacterium]
MLQSTDVIIQTRRLTHCYGKFAAIQDVDLEVRRGEVFGFLGPNGAGKTTTIRTLLDFIRPSAGSATIFGLDTRREGVTIRQRTGYLPSELVLWNNWTGLDYVRWLEQVRGRGNGHLAEAQRLAGLLDFDLKRSLRGLSTGMKRKMGLIAALLHRPELLILDEPSTGLDPLMQQVFHDLVREARAEGRTVFLSSHNLPEVEAICDRVGIIRAGRLEAVESVSDLTHVTFRWLTLTLDRAISPETFRAIAGVSDLSGEGAVLRMRISGDTDMDAVIKQAAQYTVRDLHIEHPTLEEIFLTYYGRREGNNHESRV